jgi:hypothetical protein
MRTLVRRPRARFPTSAGIPSSELGFEFKARFLGVGLGTRVWAEAAEEAGGVAVGEACGGDGWFFWNYEVEVGVLCVVIVGRRVRGKV